MIRRIWIVGLAALFATAGCRDRAPVPHGASETKPASTQDSRQAAVPTNPHETGEIQLDFPHDRGASAAAVLPGGDVDLGAINITPAKTWRFEKATSSMRRAQFKVPASTATGGEAELIVFFFGAEGAGTAQANADRWVGQFRNADGSPVTDAASTSTSTSTSTQRKISGFDVTLVDVKGSYAGGMGSVAPQESTKDQRLLGAIVETDGGPYYFKLVGPNATVSQTREAFDSMLQSMVASP